MGDVLRLVVTLHHSDLIEGNTYKYSDRDLMTEEISEVSGTTSFGYNEHGELASRLDARGVTVTRVVDALDRVTFEDFPDDSLDVTYVYDDPGVAFSLGRLTRIERDGHAVDYAYDRFGRTLQDGDLFYGYDGNGNRTTIGYPGGVSAIYAYDAADRQATLTVQQTGQPDAGIVTASSYEPAGPLASVDLGNGLGETRVYDTRYFPSAVQAGDAMPVLDWQYTTDAVGNPTAIADALAPANDRTYAYQDFQYYLSQGDGPWGALAWTYDHIGNRLSETRDTATDTYAYVPNAALGNSAQLDEIQLGAGGTRSFTYDTAGNQTQVDTAGDAVDRAYDAAGRLSRQERATALAVTSFFYDGRSFLRHAAGVTLDPPSVGTIFCDGFESGDLTAWGSGSSLCPTLTTSEPTYSSEGILHRIAAPGQAHAVFYFAGRPIAQLAESGDFLYLTTDHLGTPILATGEAGSVEWQGGFEPFGADFSGASAAGLFLRFPGQWEDESWVESDLGAAVSYNVYRWYQPVAGRYARVDPLHLVFASSFVGGNLYGYVAASPLNFVDPLGLDRLSGLLRGRVMNFSSCCVLASQNSSGGGQQKFWVPPGRSILSNDVDAIYFGSGAALKIPDGDFLVILTCQETSSSGEFRRERTGGLGGFPSNAFRPARLRRRMLPTRSSQEQEFGGAIVPPTSTCCGKSSSGS